MPNLSELKSGVDDIAQRFFTLLESLPIPTDEVTGRFYHITTSLGRTALINYSLLTRAFDDDAQDYLAWSCRNLLEIDVFMRNILLSEVKADEFASHRWIDGIEILKKLKKLELLANPSLTVSSFDAMLSDFTSKMTAEGGVITGHLITRNWANDVGLAEEFDSLNKVCSKFVHPTVWSILTEDVGAARFPDARDLFYGYGANYFMDIYLKFKGHIDKHGLRHP